MKKIIIGLAAIAIFFSGCSTIPKKEAKVIDSAVEGLEYQCAGMVEYTSKDGTLSCRHMPLAFKIGEIKLGIIYDMPADGIILPQDIVGVSRDNIKNEDVIKITVLLQSLDEDKNASNGIKISKETREKLSEFIDLQKTSLEDLKDLVEAQLGKTIFKNPKSALEHLQSSMKKYNIFSANVNLEDLE